MSLSIPDFIISPEATLRDALRRMTRNRKGILFVCDVGLHIVGALSDGDARRAVLDETLLSTAVVKVMNPNPLTASSREEATTLVEEGSLLGVPIVTSNGDIEALSLSHDGQTVVIDAYSEAGDSKSPQLGRSQALAIIPARGGSKRLPNKNLALVAGKTLTERAVEAALNSETIGDILVSTDDPTIASTAEAAGATVPWLRPPYLSTDTATTIEVVIHALEWLRKSDLLPASAVLLEPTAPLRRPGEIDAALELLLESHADSVVAVSLVPHTLHPEELVRIEGERLVPYGGVGDWGSRRLGERAQEPVFVVNGLVYAFRTDAVLETRSLFGTKCIPLVMGWDRFLDIDNSRDLEWANLRIRNDQ